MTRTVLALCIAVGTTALAADRPVTGAKLVLKRSASGRERLVFVSKDPSALFPAIGSADDPQTGNPGGALVELFSTSEPNGAALVVPPADWTAKPGTIPSHRFSNRFAPDAFSSIRTVVLKQGRLVKVTGKRTGLALATAQGNVGIRITTGSLRNCALFVAPAVRRDQAGVFDAHNASAAGLADCSNASLGGAEPTTTTSTVVTTTSTTLPPICGDGIVNQPTEQCDGADIFMCAGGNFMCRAPGVAGECRCCSNSGPYTQLVGCCNPSSILVPAPNEGGTCVATQCNQSFPCSGNDVCQPDGYCCTSPGSTCLLTVISPPIALNPCCPGSECRGPSSFGIGCCLPDGGSCGADADCCSQHCTAAACDACRGGGGACTTPFECCSLSCTGGTCDACAPNGASCITDATCCSGACDESTLSCVAGATTTTTTVATTSSSTGTSASTCPTSTTTTTLPFCESSGYPMCASGNSVCFNGHTCEVDFVNHVCTCTGPPPTCGQWGILACGGTCPAGETCQLDNVGGPGCPVVYDCHCVPSP